MHAFPPQNHNVHSRSQHSLATFSNIKDPRLKCQTYYVNVCNFCSHRSYLISEDGSKIYISGRDVDTKHFLIVTSWVWSDGSSLSTKRCIYDNTSPRLVHFVLLPWSIVMWCANEGGERETSMRGRIYINIKEAIHSLNHMTSWQHGLGWYKVQAPLKHTQ